MLTLYGMADSGNCYKPRLLLALLGRPFRHVAVSIEDGGTKRADFLRLNPAGQVPLLQLEDGRTLAESNAILGYLGEGTPFAPADAWARAQMLRWMFFEQNAHESQIAVRRALLVYAVRRAAATPERLAATLAGGHAALALMEARLAASPWLAGEAPTLADLALYPYSRRADEGGFDLGRYPALRDWFARVEALPGYRPVTWLPDAPPA